MKSLFLIFTILMSMLIQYGLAATDIPTGEVSGTWTLANSPYNINGAITIPDSQTLIIEPGVIVIFTGYFKFNVQGRLLAIGTETDSIYFTAQDSTTGWHGIRFIDTPTSNDSSKIIYCKLQYGKATGTFPDNCGGAITFSSYSKCLISNCLVTKNTADYVGGSIVLGYGSNPKICNNIITNNYAPWGGGFAAVGDCDPLIANNIIIRNEADNLGGGVQLNQNSSPILINNTIAYNTAGSGGGIDCRDNSDPTIINTIIYGNTASDGNQICLYVADCDPSFYNCNIEGGINGFGGVGSGNNYNGEYQDNINCDPFFTDTLNNDYHLSEFSLCIGSGVDSIQIGTIWHKVPLYDFEGNPRPNPIESKPDIGAFENALSDPITAISEFSDQLTNSFSLSQNYPNPFNPTTVISYTLPVTCHIDLSIYNMLGQKVKTLVNSEHSLGNYQVDWNGLNDLGRQVSSGVYIYQLNSGSSIQTRKMILMR